MAGAKQSAILSISSSAILSLVDKEALVHPFSPGSTLESGLKGFNRRGHSCHECSLPVVPVDNTTHDKRPPFSLGSCYEP
jgi:hypothetical protein